jgi:hypothetical protein
VKPRRAPAGATAPVKTAPVVEKKSATETETLDAGTVSETVIATGTENGKEIEIASGTVIEIETELETATATVIATGIATVIENGPVAIELNPLVTVTTHPGTIRVAPNEAAKTRSVRETEQQQETSPHQPKLPS